MQETISHMQEVLRTCPFILFSFQPEQLAKVIAYQGVPSLMVKKILHDYRALDRSEYDQPPVGHFLLIFNGADSVMLRIDAEVKMRKQTEKDHALDQPKVVKPVRMPAAEPMPDESKPAPVAEQAEEDAELREDKVFEAALAKIEEKQTRPTEKLHSHAVQSKGVLQNMLSQPFEPPCMVFEKEVVKEKPLPAAVVIEKQPVVDSARVDLLLKQHEVGLNELLAERELEIEKNNQMMVAQQKILDELMHGQAEAPSSVHQQPEQAAPVNPIQLTDLDNLQNLNASKKCEVLETLMRQLMGPDSGPEVPELDLRKMSDGSARTAENAV